ncbi:MAG TPA: PspC domain-containing protein [Sphingomicrobium sp.]|nr:PspC domain-containing protein [Sphingomicrobium sp.]
MTTAAITDSAFNAEQNERPTPLPLRNDTILGVCEAIGQDFGFNPIFLRIPFGVLLLWNPVVVLSVYFGLGFVVALSRWYFPAAQREAAAVKVAGAQAAPANEASKNDGAEAQERLAA